MARKDKEPETIPAGFGAGAAPRDGQESDQPEMVTTEDNGGV